MGCALGAEGAGGLGGGAHVQSVCMYVTVCTLVTTAWWTLDGAPDIAVCWNSRGKAPVRWTHADDVAARVVFIECVCDRNRCC